LTTDIAVAIRQKTSRPAGWDIAKLQQSRLYDVLMRLPMLSWSIFLALVTIVGLQQYVRQSGRELPDVVYILNIVMRLSVIAYLVVIAATLLVRVRPRAKARGVEPRISALIGTLLLTVIVLFPRRELSPSADMVSTLLTLGGSIFAVVVLTQLRESFSIMAEARQLVTTGVYRLARHPLYLAEEIAAIGVVMQFFSHWTALILAVQIGFQLRRMQNEEVVLTEIFPEYPAYRDRTTRILPGIY
jgi:protein-S-isoprenylcysteine O-methyltransferase Ste14